MHEKNIIEKINEFQGEVYFYSNKKIAGRNVETKNILIFSLSGLFQFLSDIENHKNEFDSPFFEKNIHAFQRSLYQSDINSQLQLLGGKIELYHSYGKVKKNLYCFVCE